VCDGWRRGGGGNRRQEDGRAINASNARAHERPRGSPRFQSPRARMRARERGAPRLVYEHRGYCYLCTSCQPRRSLSTPPLPHACTRESCSCSALPPLRPSSSARSRRSASKLLAWPCSRDTDTVSIASPMHPRSLRRPGDRWTRSRNPVAPIEAIGTS